MFLYVITAAKLLYTQRKKDMEILTVEEWLMKMAELVEIARLTCMIREKTILILTGDWKPFVDFIYKK